MQGDAKKKVVDIAKGKSAPKVVNKKKYLTHLEQDKIKDLDKDITALGDVNKKIGEIVVTMELLKQQALQLNAEIGKKQQALQMDLFNAYGKYQLGENFEVITVD